MGPGGSGKSYTLFGELGEFAKMGTVPRLASDILDQIGRCEGGPGGVFLTVSYCQASGSNNKIRDLLAAPPASKAINTNRSEELSQDASGMLDTLSQHRVARLSDVLLLLNQARQCHRADSGNAVGFLALHREARSLKANKPVTKPRCAFLLASTHQLRDSRL
eukprot:3941705-Rhodomonas_salina.2